jgi:hypothetical protein
MKTRTALHIIETIIRPEMEKADTIGRRTVNIFFHEVWMEVYETVADELTANGYKVHITVRDTTIHIEW